MNLITINSASPEAILANIDLALKSYRLSKDSAARAAAHIYMVWTQTLSPSADPLAREWLNELYIELTRQINNHNSKVDTLRERAKYFKANKLPTFDRDDLALKESDDPAEKKRIDAERMLLTECGKLTPQQWEDRKLTHIQTRFGASQFASLVKFVLELHHHKDTSTTARYSAVVEWIHSQFKQKSGYGVEDIVEAVQLSGGFDRVIELSRGTKSKLNFFIKELTAKELSAMDCYAITQLTKAYKDTASLETINLPCHNAKDGFVVLLGRQNGEAIELVTELNVKVGERDKIFSTQINESVLPTQAAAEFLGRAMTMGKLVTVTDLPLQAEYGLSAGEAIKSERIVTLIPDEKNGFTFQVSARHAEACVVVKATPKAEANSLGTVDRIVYLDSPSTHLLGQMVIEPNNRRMFTFGRHTESEKVIWTARNIALEPQDFSYAVRDMTWKNMASLFGQPIEVVGYSPFLVKNYSLAEILTINADIASKAGKVKNEPFDLKISGHKAILASDGRVDYDATISSSLLVTMIVQLRLHDAKALFSLLADFKADGVNVVFDKGGLIVVTLEDDLGSYEIFVPTYSAEKKGLSNRRFEQMAVLDDQSDVIAA